MSPASFPASTVMFRVYSQTHQGAPKVEKVFFTTAIPVGGNPGKLLCSELLYLLMVMLKTKGGNEIMNLFCYVVEY